MSNSQSKFVKQILVEEGEYDRLRQRQFKDDSPEIRTIMKLEQQIVENMARKDLDTQQKLDLISGLQMRFYQLKEETNTQTGLTSAKGAASPEVDAGKAVSIKATPKQQPVKDGAVNNAVQPVPISQTHKVYKLMDIIGNNPQIIRHYDSNKLEVNWHAVPGSNLDQLYDAVLSPRGSQHMAGMTELLGALRKLNVESKNIVYNSINAAYESGAARSGPLCHNDNALPSQPPKAERRKARAQPNKRGSTSPFEIEGPYEAKPATRSTPKYNTQRHGLSNVTNKNQSK